MSGCVARCEICFEPPPFLTFVMIVTEHPAPSLDELRASERTWLPDLCWRAIFGGTVAAIGIHILLTALGVGAGLATFTPLRDADPAENFSIGAAVIWTLCALVALAFGGFLAGRFSRSLHSGFVHGVLVWSLTLILTLVLLSWGTGLALGGAMKVLGAGLGIGAQAAASGVGQVASEGIKRTGAQLSSFIDEAVQAGPTNASPQVMTRSRREIGFALTRLFNPANDAALQENRAAAVKAMKDYAGMNDAEANKAVEDWTASYKALQDELAKEKAQLEQKARETADRAASQLSKAGLWAFFALLVGLLVTAVSGSYGATGALRAMGPLSPGAPRIDPRSTTTPTASSPAKTAP